MIDYQEDNGQGFKESETSIDSMSEEQKKDEEERSMDQCSCTQPKTLFRKQSSADMRRKGPGSSSKKDDEIPRSTSTVSITSYNAETSLSDVLEPVDFEDVVEKMPVVRNPALVCLADFPGDDLEVLVEKRPCRTEQPNLPEKGAESNLLIRDCLKCYTKNFTVVNRRYQACVRCHANRQANAAVDYMTRQEYEMDAENEGNECYRPLRHGSIHLNSASSPGVGGFGRGSWSSGIADLRQTPSDPVLPGLLDPRAGGVEERDRENSLRRQRNRQERLFEVYLPPDPEFMVEERATAHLPSDQWGGNEAGSRLLIDCTHLKLDLEIEPIFASLALYDLSARRKISENFYFDANAQSMMAMLSQHVSRMEITTMAQRCIVNLTYPSPDIFIVVRLEKVLQQGDINDVVDTYLKEDKNKDKLRTNVQWFCERLGRYRMPLAWTAIDLMGTIMGISGPAACPPGFSGDQRDQSPVPSLAGARSDSLSQVSPGGSAMNLDTMSMAGSTVSGATSSRGGPGASLRRARNMEDFLMRRTSSADVTKRYSFTSEDLERTLETFKPISLTVNTFFKQEADKMSEEDLFKYLSDLRRPSAVMKRLKNVPGCLRLQIQPCPPNLPCVVSPELLRIQPYPSDEKTRPIKEVIEFPAREVYAANSFYRNILYVYPKQVNFSGKQGSSRNIAVRVQFMMIEADRMRPLPVIFGKSSCPEFSDEAYTTVLYHNKSPDFHEEIKLLMPGNLQEGHFLLFTFYHISCQARKTDVSSVDNLIGYSWLPLLRGGRLDTGDFSLLIAQERPSPTLSMIRPELSEMTEKAALSSYQYCLDATKWVDSHKELFRVSISAMSTVHPQDAALDRFLRACHVVDNCYSGTGRHQGTTAGDSFAAEVKCALQCLTEAALEPLVRFSTLVFDRLLLILVRPPIFSESKLNFAQIAFETICQLVNRICLYLPDKNDRHGRSSLLISYIKYAASIPVAEVAAGAGNGHGGGLMRPVSMPSGCQYGLSSMDDITDIYGTSGGQSFPVSATSSNLQAASGKAGGRNRKYLHEEILLQWIVAIQGSGKEEIFDNAWFFFELLIRSMSEYLVSTDLISNPRRSRFSDQFMEDLTSLITVTTRYLADRGQDRHAASTSLTLLNRALAFFIADLFSIMDRTFIQQNVKHYCKTVTAKISVVQEHSSLVHFKLDFLRIVCSHEHYIPLNLPLLASERDLLDSICSERYRQTHFLVGLVLSELRLCLDTSNSSLHAKAVNLVWHLLSSHEADPRFSDKLVLSRVAQLYLPIIHVATDVLNSLSDPQGMLRTPLQSPLNDDGTINSSPSFSSCNVLQDAVDRVIGENSIMRGLTPSGDFDTANGQLSATSTLRKRKQLSAESSRLLLLCCLWVLKHVDRTTLQQWLLAQNSSRISLMLELFMYSAANFEYKPGQSFKLMKHYQRRHCNRQRSKQAPVRECLLEGLDVASPMPAISDFSVSTHHQGSRRSSVASSGRSLVPRLYRRAASVDESASMRRARSYASLGDPAAGAMQGSVYPSPSASVIGSQGKRISKQIKKSADMKARLEDNLLGNTSARSELMRRKNNQSDKAESGSAEGSAEARLRWRKEHTSWRLEDAQPTVCVELDPVVEGNLALEVTMVMLDSLELIVQTFGNSETLQCVLSLILRVLLQSLSLTQCVTAIQNLLASQRSLVTKFPDFIFEEETEQCGNLCFHLLRHCSSSLQEVRSHSAASLYMLMRHNFELGNTEGLSPDIVVKNFARVKMQVTMALSSLVAQRSSSGNGANEEWLRRALRTLLTYAEADVDLYGTSFTDQVQELVFNLHMILSDTIKMREFEEDPEMLIDLMYRIAKGYQNSPDLRLTWLQNMAAKHSTRGQHAEAAQCLVHSAALVAEYLGMMEPLEYMPVGCAAFSAVSANVLEESAVSDDVVSPDEEGVCCSLWFSQRGLVGLVEQAATEFNQAGHYEMVPELHKVLLALHEANREYAKLASIHKRIHDAYELIMSKTGKRMFGSYFRVGFYGTKFGDLDGEEFIYKEPPLTKLHEIAHRLENFYGDRFGNDILVIIKDSNTVERDSLDAGKAYIQITYVEPYFESYELRRRSTRFERSYNIKTFVYATPFTVDGRAHGELHEQYKRKTLLTTARAFPYVKTRLSVVKREQLELSPVQVALEDLEKKVEELTRATRQEPPDAKILQMQLQGCIGTTVNQGPVEMAVVFLTAVAEGKEPMDPDRNRLRLCFKEFLRRANDALTKNRQLISPEQKEYQKELERNFETIKRQLDGLLTIRQSRRSRSRSGKHRRADSPGSSVA